MSAGKTKRGTERKKAGAGYQRSRYNPIKHGLTAEHVVLPGEDADAFEELKQQLFEEFKPEGVILCGLLSELAGVEWKLRRCARIEQACHRQAQVAVHQPKYKELLSTKELFDEIGVSDRAKPITINTPIETVLADAPEDDHQVEVRELRQLLRSLKKHPPKSKEGFQEKVGWLPDAADGLAVLHGLWTLGAARYVSLPIHPGHLRRAAHQGFQQRQDEARLHLYR